MPYLGGVVYTVGAISRNHLDSGDCQEFFLLIVPADEDLVSLNFGQDDALHIHTALRERERTRARTRQYCTRGI